MCSDRLWFILIQTSFFRTNQRYRNSSLLFLYFFKIKETKDYVTSPRVWTCDFLLPFYVISLPVNTQKIIYYVPPATICGFRLQLLTRLDELGQTINLQSVFVGR